MVHRDRIRTLTALLAVSMLLPACVAGSPSEMQASASPVEEGLSAPAQWALFAQRQQAEWDVWADSRDLASCGPLAGVGEESVDCKILAQNATTMAATAVQWWVGAVTPGHSEFIASKPPEEVSELVTATLEAVAAADSNAAAWVAADCGNVGGVTCPSLGADFEASIDALRSVLADWNAHLT